MSKTTILIIFILVLFSISATPKKFDVCHFPPGNPQNAHVITVSGNAIGAHLAHGDYIMYPGMTCPAEQGDLVYILYIPMMPVVGCDAQQIGTGCV